MDSEDSMETRRICRVNRWNPRFAFLGHDRGDDEWGPLIVGRPDAPSQNSRHGN